MKHHATVILTCLIFWFFISSCAAPTPSVGVIQTAIAQTQFSSIALAPTQVDSPTLAATSTISLTPTPTRTATPTSTPTKTATPTLTSTPTLEPPLTQTAMSKRATSTAQSLSKTATAEARDAMLTSTASVKSAKATEIASYIEVPQRDLITYPEKFTGQKIKFRGRVFNVVNNTTLQMYVGWTYDAVYVEMRRSFSDIYEDDYLVIYGIAKDKYCFKNRLNAEICQPLITNAFYEK